MNKLVLPLIIIASFGTESLVFAKTVANHKAPAKNVENKKISQDKFPEIVYLQELNFS